jgi:hypothetical protein
MTGVWLNSFIGLICFGTGKSAHMIIFFCSYVVFSDSDLQLHIHVQSTHPSIYTFIDVIRQIQYTTIIKIRGLDTPAIYLCLVNIKISEIKIFPITF